MSPRPSASLTLEHVILALLDRQPMHGYELYQELRVMPGISLIWNLKQPLLYALLDKLEARGYLSSRLALGETYPPRKVFHLTGTGESSLQAWMAAPVRRARDLRQEFLAKLMVARRYGKNAALDLIHAQRRLCQTWLDDLSALDLTPAGVPLDEWFVYSFRANRVAAVLKWLDACEAEIERRPSPPDG